MGAGLFRGNLGSAIKNHLLNKDPHAARQMEIELKDERNIAIGQKAKAKAYDLMLFVYGALLLAFVLMRVELYILLALVAAYLLLAFMIYYINKYQKEM